ncbi:MAG: hypothetical protein FWH33_00735 [Oscillospiraceae bacterium]|nr:hypothetical protein [Oscillospiraceae bacterium]
MNLDATSDFQPKEPLLLVRNVRYPSYQLWAIAGSPKNREDVLKIVVLRTMQWLHERFRENELPEELDFPPAGDYKTVDSTQFSNVHIKYGYQLEIIWLPDEKIWSLQLTEPDLGPNPGQDEQDRHPVAGRIFETNISYQISDKGVLCGFQTMVTEPEGTPELCEVYRLGVIKHLKRDPLVGLSQIWQLEETPHSIRSQTEVKAFQKKLKAKERTLPVVIVAEYTQPSKKQSIVKMDLNKPTLLPPDITSLSIDNAWNRRADIESLLLKNKDAGDRNIETSKPVIPHDLEGISHYRMGYAHFFVVAADILSEFDRVTGLSLSNGGVLFCPPFQIDSQISVFSHDEVMAGDFALMLDTMVQDYSREKHFDFSFCCFVPQAQIIQSEKTLSNINSVAELKAFYTAESARSAELQSKQLAEIESERQQEFRKFERLHEEEIARIKGLEMSMQRLLEKQDYYKTEAVMYENRLMALRSRPQKPSDVCDWAEQSFPGRVVILERARRTMKDIKNNDVDMRLLCDSLEYLANEYCDELNGQIDESERDLRCSKYYNRPFEVIPNSESALMFYPEDYTVPYVKNGKRNDVKLTLHLRVGSDSEKHVRIYFFYDKDDRRIVIGSMPKHLRIASYQ